MGMKVKIKRVVLWTVLIIVVLVATLIVLYSYTDAVDKGLLQLINLAVDHDIRIKYERLEGNLFGDIRIRDVQILTKRDSIYCESISLKYSSADLLSGKIIVEHFQVNSPRVFIHLPPDTSRTSPETTSEIAVDSLLETFDLSSVPYVKVQTVFVKDGRLVVKNGGQPITIDQISIEGNMQITPKRVELRLRYLKGNWVEKDIRLEHISFYLGGNKRRVTLNQMEAQLNGAKISAHGEIEFQPRMRFYLFADTSRIDFALVKKIFPQLPVREGALTIYGEYIGTPRNFTGQFYMRGDVDSLQFRSVRFEYHYANRALTLKKVDFRSNFGRLSGSVYISPRGKNRVDLTFSNINLKGGGIAPVYTRLTGTVKLNFTSWNLNRITGSGFARLVNGVYHQSRFDTLYLNLSVKRGNWKISRGSRLTLQKASRFFVEGEMSRDKILDVQMYTDDNNLDTLSSRLNLGLLGGQGSMNLHVTGPLFNPNVSGYFLLDSLVVQQNKAYGVEGQFEVGGMIRERRGYFVLDLFSGVVENYPITDGTMELKIEKNTVHLDSVSFYSGDNYIALSGRFNKTEQGAEFILSRLDLYYENYHIYAPDTLQAFLVKDSIRIENFLLNATGRGEIEVRGELDLTGSSALAVYFKNIQLFPFNQFIRMKKKIEGKLEIEVVLSGTMDSPVIESSFDLQDFSLGGDTLGNVSANLMYEQNRLSLSDFRFLHSENSYLTLKGFLDLPEKMPGTDRVSFNGQDRMEIRCDFSDIQISDYPFIKDFNFPVRGNFSGSIALEGPVRRPLGTYLLDGDRVRYQDFFFPTIHLDGRIAPDKVLLDYANINFKNTVITANGIKFIHWDVDQPENILKDKRFSLFVKIQDDSLNFLDVLTPEVDILTGDIRIEARLGGEVDRPELISGSVDISHGTLYLAKVENPITNLRFQAEVEDRKLVIKKGTAVMKGDVESRSIFRRVVSYLFSPLRRLLYPVKREGHLAFKGNIDFTYPERPKFNLEIDANRVYVNYYIENARMLVSAKDLTVSGRDTITIAGDVTVHKADIDLDLKESEKNLLLSPTVRESPPYMRYLLNVSIPGNFYVRSEAAFNSFEMQVMGDLRIIQEPKQLLEMYGNLEVPTGKYFQFEEFDIRNGRIEFVNPKELPELDIYAEKRKYGFIFRLHVSGSLTNPVKEIRILDMATEEDVTHLYPETKDQISLLLFGVTFSELGSSAGSLILNKGEEVINQALISQIEKEARRFVGLDQIRLESQESLIDFRNRRLNQSLEESSLSLGKYLTPHLYLEYKTRLTSAGLPGLGQIPAPRLSWEAGNQIYLEYRINRNWSISTFYEKRENDRFKIDISWRHNF